MVGFFLIINILNVILCNLSAPSFRFRFRSERTLTRVWEALVRAVGGVGDARGLGRP